MTSRFSAVSFRRKNRASVSYFFVALIVTMASKDIAWLFLPNVGRLSLGGDTPTTHTFALSF